MRAEDICARHHSLHSVMDTISKHSKNTAIATNPVYYYSVQGDQHLTVTAQSHGAEAALPRLQAPADAYFVEFRYHWLHIHDCTSVALHSLYLGNCF